MRIRDQNHREGGSRGTRVAAAALTNIATDVPGVRPGSHRSRVKDPNHLRQAVGNTQMRGHDSPIPSRARSGTVRAHVATPAPSNLRKRPRRPSIQPVRAGMLRMWGLAAVTAFASMVPCNSLAQASAPATQDSATQDSATLPSQPSSETRSPATPRSEGTSGRRSSRRSGRPSGRPSGRRTISLDDDFLVEGKLEKPSAFYILRRSSLDYDWARLDAKFTPLVLESVQDPLF